MNKVKILVVEDQHIIRKIYEHVLLEDVFDRRFAGDGEEALRLYKSWGPEIILLDVMLPIMNGFAVLKEIREKIGDKSTTIIMQTSMSNKEDIVHCLALGIQGYVVKPFDQRDIVAKILSYYKAVNLERASAASAAMQRAVVARRSKQAAPSSKSSGTAIGCSPQETEYMTEVLSCLEDSEISQQARKMLERLRVKLEISEERAAELESSLRE